MMKTWLLNLSFGHTHNPHAHIPNFFLNCILDFGGHQKIRSWRTLFFYRLLEKELAVSHEDRRDITVLIWFSPPASDIERYEKKLLPMIEKSYEKVLVVEGRVVGQK